VIYSPTINFSTFPLKRQVKAGRKSKQSVFSDSFKKGITLDCYHKNEFKSSEWTKKPTE
jgi:hypothetical protein